MRSGLRTQSFQAVDARGRWAARACQLLRLQQPRSQQIPLRIKDWRFVLDGLLDIGASGEPFLNYHDGVLHAEGVSLPDIAAQVGTPFYCIRPQPLAAPLQGVFRRGSPTSMADGLLRMKANSNQAVLKTWRGSGPASMWSPKASCVARWPPAFQPRKSCSPASARPRVKWTPRWTPTSFASTRIRARTRTAQHPRPGNAQGRADLLPHQSRCRCEDPRQDLDRQEGRQVRHLWRGAQAVYKHAAGLPGVRVTGIDMDIGSQITEYGLQPFDDALRLMVELVETLRADGHAIHHFDIGGGLGVPYRDGQCAAAGSRCLRGNGQGPAAQSGLQGHPLKPGRLIVANAGVLVSKSSTSRMAATRPSSSSTPR